MSRALLLYGTEEVVAPIRRVIAGRLSADIDRGNVRYVRWDNVEVLRAISFVVRDSAWGTYSPVIEDLTVETGAEGFTMRYSAGCAGTEGDFHYRAEIAGRADGSLRFEVAGGSDGGFTTNRTGFVVLHGLAGVTGRLVEVAHANGDHSTAVFPGMVTPDQPIFDIRQLTHSPRSGLSVAVRMEGDAFEMEDQRNWTDASFKTYVRPLSRGWPYKIAGGVVLEQRVTLTLRDEGAVAAVPSSSDSAVAIGTEVGVMPEIGLACRPGDLDLIGHLAGLRPSYLVGRVDTLAPEGTWGLRELGELTAKMRCSVDIDIVIAGMNPDDELTAVASAFEAASVKPKRVLVLPARDLRSRSANHVPEGEASPASILAAARSAFVGCEIGGGTVVGFPELNRNRPPHDIDFVAHSTQAIVHAADDLSVFETLEALPDVVRTTRSFVPGVRYRLGPGTIGAPRSFYAVSPADNPGELRKATAERDPRQRGLFGAAFALGYAAIAARLGVEAITLSSCSGPAGVLGRDGLLPIATIVKGLAALAGHRLLETRITGKNIDALAASTERGIELWIVNKSAEPTEVEVDRVAFPLIRVIDAAALQRQPAATIEFDERAAGAVRLDSYAVCCLREG